MKKIITTFLLSGLFAFSAFAQPIFEEDFENGMPSSFTIIDGDGNTVASNIAHLFPPAWNALIFTNDPSNSFAASTSWYSPAGQSDDWMIMPSISLTNNNYLFWDGLSADGSAPETYEVLISTTTTDTSDFTVLTTVSGENNSWTSRSFDLAAAGYSNQTVHIAFRNVSDDKYLLAVDNIMIREVQTLDMKLTDITTGDIATMGSSVNVTADVVNYGFNTVTSFDFNWSTDGRATVNTHSMTGLNLSTNDEMSLTHNTALVPSNPGSITNLEVWISNVNNSTDLDLSNNALTQDIFVNTGAIVNKESLLEEFTTAVCQYCPDGASTVDTITYYNPDVIAVGVHSGFYTDAMTTPAATAYADFTTGAPAAMIDRVLYEGETMLAFSDRSKWRSRADSMAAIGAPVAVDIKGNYDPNTRTANVTVETNFVDYVKPGDLRVVLYVVEDSVTGSGFGLNGYDQSNAYNTVPGHPYFGKGNPIVGFVHRHVLRKVYPLNQFWGDTNSITVPIVPNTMITNNYTVTVDNAWNEDQVNLVAYVAYQDSIDLSEKYILNANSVDIQEMWAVGLEEQAAKVGMKVYPNPFREETNVSFNLKESQMVSIQMFDIAGKQVKEKQLGQLSAGEHMEKLDVESLDGGFYFIRLNVGNSSVMKKVSILK